MAKCMVLVNMNITMVGLTRGTGSKIYIMGRERNNGLTVLVLLAITFKARNVGLASIPGLITLHMLVTGMMVK